jgi:hypothetical protein
MKCYTQVLPLVDQTVERGSQWTPQINVSRTLAPGSLGFSVQPLLEGHLSTQNLLEKYVVPTSGYRHLLTMS